MTILKRKIFYLIIITIFFQLNFVACGHDCHWEYEGTIDYNVDSITIKEYDANTHKLLDEFSAYSFDSTQSGFTGVHTAPIENIIGSSLDFVGTVSGSTRINVYFTIGDEFEELELGKTINDANGDYLSLDYFYLPLEIADIEYEIEDTVMLSYSLSGYQATVRKYPYTLNEEGEKTYYDTMEATIAFDNVVLNEEDQEKSLFCRD